MTDFPFITVVMPVRNEARFIADTLGHLLSQAYPKERFEILVADGMSDDGTRDIVARIAADDDRVRLLDNPKLRSSAGRNVGFRTGRGNYFVVVDGHCHIPDNQFLRHIAECFKKSGADCLGRPQPLDPPGLSPFQESVALARASRLGHGGDSLIYGDFEGFASPVSNGAAYRREVFETVGYVDEDFDACEDVEFNYRVKQAGLKAYTSPKLTVRYYPRENLPALVAQMRRYGRGRTRLYRKHPALLSLSALVPACFAGGAAAFVALLCLELIFGLSAFLVFFLSALGLALLTYAVLVGMATVRICRKDGWEHGWRLPLVFSAIHWGLGLGMWEEFFLPVRRFLARKRRAGGPLRVAFLIDTIVSPTAGTERQLLLLLDTLDRREFEPRLCVLRSSKWLETEFRLCPLHVVGFGSFKSPVAWWRALLFILWLRNERVDCLQTHFTDSSKVGIICAWLARVPGIVATRKNQGYWMTRRELFLQKVLNRFPDVLVANSEATRQWAHHTEGISTDRIRVIPNGLAGDPVPVSNERRAIAREILGLPSDVPVAGIVANLRPVKRIDVFLRAAANVTKEMPDARFVVVGEGDERGKLEALCLEFSLSDKVIFLGRRSDVMEILPAFDVGVLSSDSESFSNAVVEYMAAGLSVAASDVGGCREALGESPGGAMVPPGDPEALGKAMVRLLVDDNVLAYARSQHPLRVQDLFSRDRYIAAYSELYRDLLGIQGMGAA